jgi:hypothetical protein
MVACGIFPARDPATGNMQLKKGRQHRKFHAGAWCDFAHGKLRMQATNPNTPRLAAMMLAVSRASGNFPA